MAEAFSEIASHLCDIKERISEMPRSRAPLSSFVAGITSKLEIGWSAVQGGGYSLGSGFLEGRKVAWELAEGGGKMMAVVPWNAVPGWWAEASYIFSESWCSVMGRKGCDA